MESADLIRRTRNRLSPWGEFDRFFSAMEEMMNPLPTSCARMPAMDLKDLGAAFELTAEVPGFERDEIQIHLDDRRLELKASAEKSGEDRDDAGTYVHREISRKSMNRTVVLPAEVDRNSVNASLANGVLTVTMEKKKPTARVEIQID